MADEDRVERGRAKKMLSHDGYQFGYWYVTLTNLSFSWKFLIGKTQVYPPNFEPICSTLGTLSLSYSVVLSSPPFLLLNSGTPDIV